MAGEITLPGPPRITRRPTAHHPEWRSPCGVVPTWADLHHAAGQDEQARAHLKRAVAIFSEVGADEAPRVPEIWKLVR